MDNKPFAEVIASSLDTFTAQCWQWDEFPPFGSLVQVEGEDPTILGCVTSVQTGSMDPLRYPFPYKKTEGELQAEQPQIFEFLKTIFTVNVMGSHDRSKKVRYMLPSRPSKIHAFIQSCSPELATKFFSSPDFLYLLFSSSATITHFDDLLLAIFEQLGNKKKLTPSIINTFCQTLSLLTGNDYRRMKLFLKRLENIDNNLSK
ncbi:hypothetical protein KKA53_02765 [Candidatus Dependentiae bacterium]|nr:hypothetical protein [Candidatus Dependentiae bacterium]